MGSASARRSSRAGRRSRDLCTRSAPARSGSTFSGEGTRRCPGHRAAVRDAPEPANAPGRPRGDGRGRFPGADSKRVGENLLPRRAQSGRSQPHTGRGLVTAPPQAERSQGDQSPRAGGASVPPTRAAAICATAWCFRPGPTRSAAAVTAAPRRLPPTESTGCPATGHDRVTATSTPRPAGLRPRPFPPRPAAPPWCPAPPASPAGAPARGRPARR